MGITEAMTKATSSSKISLKVRQWMLFVAIASFLTEMILAQMASVLWGGVLTKYILSMGIFILALGLGSLYQPKGVAGEKLAWQQLVMSGMSIFSPWLVLWSGTHLYSWFAKFIAASAVFVVGFWSGMEFPLIASIASEEVGADFSFVFSELLRLDYLGMAISSLFFPVFLLRNIGVFQASFLAAGVNLFIAAMAFWQYMPGFRLKKSSFKFQFFLVLGFILIASGWVLNKELISLAQEWMIQ